MCDWVDEQVVSEGLLTLDDFRENISKSPVLLLKIGQSWINEYGLDSILGPFVQSNNMWEDTIRLENDTSGDGNKKFEPLNFSEIARPTEWRLNERIKLYNKQVFCKHHQYFIKNTTQ